MGLKRLAGVMYIKYLWLIIPLSLFLGACYQDDSLRTVQTLNVALLPDQNASKIRSEYQPLLEYLKSYTGLNAQLMIPESYEELLRWFDNKQVDLVLFGGVTFYKAQLNSNAIPLVMRDVDNRFKSVAIVRVRDSANSLQDLRGATLIFGPRLSTSGHLMPRYFFRQQNIIPETFFSDIKYSDSHEQTIEWVRDGKAEVGIVNSGVIDKMYLDGRLTKNVLEVTWESPPYTDYVWAIQPDIREQQRFLVRDAFLSMHLNSENNLLMGLLGAHYYIPAVKSDFRYLAKVIMQVEQQGAIQ